MNASWKAEFEDLLRTAIDSPPEAVDWPRLEALLEEHPEAVAAYVELMTVHSLLRWRRARHAGSGLSLRADRAIPRSSVLGFLRRMPHVSGESPLATALTWLVMAILSTGVVLTIIFCVALIVQGINVRVEQARSPESPRTASERSGSEASPASSADRETASVADSIPHRSTLIPPPAATVARLVQAYDCHWAIGSHSPRTGDDLEPGRKLVLNSGLAEIMFQSGVRTVLQGPATLEVNSKMSAFLRRGRVTVSVIDPDARGFVIDAPGMKYTDLGTEFGVFVAKDGAQEMHVFRGRVQAEVAGSTHDSELSTKNSELSTQAPLILSAHQAIRVAARDKPFEPIDADESRFVRPRQLVKIMGEHSPEFVRWKKSFADCCKRSDLVAGFDFQPDESDRAMLPNRSAAGSSYDGKMVGGRFPGEGWQWVDGRMPGKSALRLSQSNSGVKLNIPGKFKELTLATWVRIDKLQGHWYEGLFMSDDWDRPGVIHWQVNGKGEIVLGSHWGAPPDNFLSQRTLGARDLGKWHQLAATYSASGRKVAFYIDAAPAGDLQAMDTEISPGSVTLGNWCGSKLQEHDNRVLDGCMDEMLLFRKALSAAEIRALYEAGKPPAGGS